MNITPLSSSRQARRARTRRAVVGTGIALAAGGMLAIAAPLAASAHVSATTTSTAAGSYTLVTFAVPHGCDGSPTTVIDITIPDGISSVTPGVNPNWDVAKTEVQLAEPQTDSHGASITERVSNVVYTAKTPLADGYRDTMTLQVQLPEDAEGETLEFPVAQTCEVGSTDWNEPTVEGQDEPEHPAPAVVVTAAETESGHGHGGTGDDDATSAEASETAASSASAAGSTDVLARVLGIGGLVVGVVGVAVAVVSRRGRNA